jgi:hypothetical protein
MIQFCRWLHFLPKAGGECNACRLMKQEKCATSVETKTISDFGNNPKYFFKREVKAFISPNNIHQSV